MEIAMFFANSLWEILLFLLLACLLFGQFPNSFPIPFQQCPAAVQEPLRAFPSGYWQKARISIYFPRKNFLLLLIENIEGK
jgi:hypothetical protein